MQQMQFWYLGREDPLEREWKSTPVSLPGESHGQRSQVGDSPWGHKEWTTTESLNNWTCLVNEFWAELTFPFRAGGLNLQHKSPESTLLGQRTSSTHGGGCSSQVEGLIRATRPSWFGIIWARINFGSLKMLRTGGDLTTAQPGACCDLRRTAGKMQETEFSLGCSWATHNLVG